MNKQLLRIDKLEAEVAGKRVLNGVSMEIDRGEVVVLIAVNGSGKSSFARVLAGSNQYEVVGGEVELEGKNLLKMKMDERAKVGIFLAYQNPVALPGVKVFILCKTAHEAQGNRIESVVEFKKKIEDLLVRVGLPREYVGREVNEGFSGGEKKRLELLQLLLLQPKLAILDEIDSGMDVQGRQKVREIVSEMQSKGTAFLVITHYDDLLEKDQITRTQTMKHGRV